MWQGWNGAKLDTGWVARALDDVWLADSSEGTRALIEVLLLHRSLPFSAVHAALDAVERIGSADPALVAIEARRIADRRSATPAVDRPALVRFDRPAPVLAGYDGLLAGSAR